MKRRGNFFELHDSGSVKFAIKNWLESSSCLGVRALRESIQLFHNRIIQLNQSRRGIFFKVFDLGGTGNRQHHRRFSQQPGDCDLRGSGLQSLRDKLQWSARFREIAGCEGKPWDEPDIFVGTAPPWREEQESKSRLNYVGASRRESWGIIATAVVSPFQRSVQGD